MNRGWGSMGRHCACHTPCAVHAIMAPLQERAGETRLFVDEGKLAKLCTLSHAEDPAKAAPIVIDPEPSFVHGTLHNYQVHEEHG